MSLTIRAMHAATDLPGVAELYSQSNPEPTSPEEILEWDTDLVEGGLRFQRELTRRMTSWPTGVCLPSLLCW